MTPEQQIARGKRAQTVLSDPLVAEALAHLKTSVCDLFFELPLDATKEREFLHLMDKARQQFEACFIVLINGAEISKHELMAVEHTAARVAAIRRSVAAMA